MSLATYSVGSLGQFVGREIGVSNWHPVPQERIDHFADCTGDRQWIHVDVDRAQREGLFGGTVAHGYLTLSLAGPLSIEAGAVPAGTDAVLNYGLNKVRFLTPVRAGARIRNRITLTAAEDKGHGRVLITLQNSIEIEGEAKPALAAESLMMLIGAAT